MASASFPEPVGQVLTADEYDALPENALREIVDGVVHLMPTPTSHHQYIARHLANQLDDLGRPYFRAVGPIEARLGDVHRRNPDVLVVPAEAYGRTRCRYDPSEIRLVVEVVSPGSETIDRKHKHAEYARAGIPHYWRAESELGIQIHTFVLGPAGYVETGTFMSGETVMVDGLERAQVVVMDDDN